MDVLTDDGDHIVVRGVFAGTDRLDLGYVAFEPADIFIEHYWRSRWYSVKEVHHPVHGHKGWYCDVARPALIDADSVTSSDLDLDVWVSADGKTLLVLDEDEFAASGLAETDPAGAANAVAALSQLQMLAADRFADL